MSNDKIHYTDGIIFSLDSEIVWASWPGRSGRTKLGDYDHVTYMMRNFLAQCELGERMAGKTFGKDSA